MTRVPLSLPRMDDYPLSSTSAQFFSRALAHNQRIERLRRSLGTARRGYESHEARRRRILRQQYLGDQPGSSARLSETTGKRRKVDEPAAQSNMAHLHLELIHCDGGRFKDTPALPESVLDDNEQVYCTRSSQCNMVFQYVRGKCFTLEKMVIRGPSDGYTSPVQEGYIYVTMDKSDLFTPCNELVHFEDDEDDDNDDEDQEESDDDEEEEDEDADINDLEFPLLEPCEHTPTTRTSRMSLPRIEFAATAGENQGSPLQPAARFSIRRDEVGNKMKATITFDPPITGRYILTKFYSQNKRENIDIEFIGVYGYVGRRFFPAVTMR